MFLLALFAAVLLLQLWRVRGPTASKLPTERLCLPGTLAHMYAHICTLISQQHPMQGLLGPAHMLLHMRWRVRLDCVHLFLPPTPHSTPPVSSVFVCCPLFDWWPLFPHTQYTPPYWMADQKTRPVNQVTLHLVRIGDVSLICVSKQNKSLQVLTGASHKASGMKTLMITFKSSELCWTFCASDEVVDV